MKAIVWLLFIVVVAYNWLDVWQTKLLIDLGAEEANPLMRYLFDITGDVSLIALCKFLILSLLGTLIYFRLKREGI